MNILRRFCTNKYLGSKENSVFFSKYIKQEDNKLLFTTTKDIKKNEILFYFGSDFFLTNKEYVNADNRQETQKIDIKIDEIMKNIKKNIPKVGKINNNLLSNTTQLLKIVVQIGLIYKNKLQVNEDFKNIIINEINDDNHFSKNPLFWSQELSSSIYSDIFLEKYETYMSYLIVLYEYFAEKFDYFLSEVEFFKIFTYIRKNISPLNTEDPSALNRYIIFSPFISKFSISSHLNNCNINTFYNFMEDDSLVYFTYNNNKIEDNLILNFGNIDNKELILKYSKISTGPNLNDYYELSNNIDSEQFQLTTNYDLKLKMLRTNIDPDFETDTIILYKHKFNKDVFNTLRILFLTDLEIYNNSEIPKYTYSKFSNVINRQNESLVLNYLEAKIKSEIKVIEKKLKKIDFEKLEHIDSKENVQLMREICDSDMEILLANLAFIDTYKLKLIE